MPTYEYKCDACGHAFERFQPITSDPIRKCPQCGKNKVKRLIGIGAGMIFKGSGFYITDYRDSSYKDKAKADSPPSSDSAEKKPDTKPAATGGESSPTAADPKPAVPAVKSEPAPAKPQKASRSARKK